MKTTGCMVVLVLGLAGGCRASRLGQDPVIPAAFAQQAQKRGKEPAPLTADDSHAIMARHAEPMQPASASPGQTMVLPTPQLGKQSP